MRIKNVKVPHNRLHGQGESRSNVQTEFLAALMKKRILVVEDEEPLRFLYEEELKEDGYDVLTACNGKEALLKIEEEKPDLIILDIVMPIMDGMEALGRIVGKYKGIPIILSTSYSEYRQDFMSWAADAYVVKSSDLRELKAKISELLRKTEVC